jgi:hypothetical protein
MKDRDIKWTLLKFDKGDVFFYLITGVILLYIWKISNISINLIFPFIILCIIIYFRQDYLHIIDLKIDHKLEEIKNTILKENYTYLENNSELLYWLNDILIYKRYNSLNFSTLLDLLNKFYSNNDIYYLHLCIKTFENFEFSLPIQIFKTHYLKKLELKKILYKNLKNPKYKMVEMQSYIPFNFFNDEFNYLI